MNIQYEESVSVQHDPTRTEGARTVVGCFAPARESCSESPYTPKLSSTRVATELFYVARAAAVEAPSRLPGEPTRRGPLSLGRTGWCGPAAGSSARRGRRGRRGRRRVGRPLAACVAPRYRPYRPEKLGALAECGDLPRRPRWREMARDGPRWLSRAAPIIKVHIEQKRPTAVCDGVRELVQVTQSCRKPLDGAVRGWQGRPEK